MYVCTMSWTQNSMIYDYSLSVKKKKNLKVFFKWVANKYSKWKENHAIVSLVGDFFSLLVVYKMMCFTVSFFLEEALCLAKHYIFRFTYCLTWPSDLVLHIEIWLQVIGLRFGEKKKREKNNSFKWANFTGRGCLPSSSLEWGLDTGTWGHFLRSCDLEYMIRMIEI